MKPTITRRQFGGSMATSSALWILVGVKTRFFKKNMTDIVGYVCIERQVQIKTGIQQYYWLLSDICCCATALCKYTMITTFLLV